MYRAESAPAVPRLGAAPRRRPLRRPPADQGAARALRRQEEARAVLPGAEHPEPRQTIPGRAQAARLPAGREQQGPAPAPVQAKNPPRAVNSRWPGSSQPRNRRLAAGHRHVRQHRGALGDLLCCPAQEWGRRPAKTHPVGQAVQAPPPRKRQAAVFTNRRKRRSVRQFLVYGLVHSRRPVWLREAASRERENPGNRLSYIRRRKQLPARFPPRSPAPKPTHSRRGRQSPFARTGRQRFPRRPELPLLGGVSAIRLVRQEHAEFPTPHSHPLVAACPRPVQQERGKLPDPHSRPLAAVCPRPVRQERARPPDLHSRPSAAAYPRPVQQERAKPPDPHSRPLAAARLRPVWQERARTPDLHSRPLAAVCPRPVWQGPGPAQPPVGDSASPSGMAGTRKAPGPAQPPAGGSVPPSGTAGTRKAPGPAQPPVGDSASPSGMAGTRKAPGLAQPPVGGSVPPSGMAGTHKAPGPAQPPVGGSAPPSGTAGTAAPDAKKNCGTKRITQKTSQAQMTGGARQKKTDRRRKGGPNIG